MLYTVDGERFAGLNIRSFSFIKVLKEILSCCLGHKCPLFSTIKERYLNSRKNSHGTPENREKHKSLAQQIFPVYGINDTQTAAKLLKFDNGKYRQLQNTL